MPNNFYHIRGLVKAAGLARSIEILLRRAMRATSPVVVNVRDYKLEVRPTDSDLFVLSQIFGWEEYGIAPERLDHLRIISSEWQAAGITPLVIDAGANVGYSSLYFSALFPGACVIAVEPDEANFAMLKRHVAGHPAVRVVHAALWSHDRGINILASDTGSWGFHVAEGAGTPSIRLDKLISNVPNARPLLIKLDIEGAEREVVESCPAVFADTKCIMVEPHDFKYPGALSLAPLYKAIANRRFDTILSGENLILFAAE